jgi:RHS repeat-associated protein
VVSNTYLPQMVLDSVSGNNTYVYNTDYDAAGRVTLRELGASGGLSIIKNAYAYFDWSLLNGQGRLQNIHSYKGASDLQNLTYTYDANGNIKTIVDAQNSNQKQCFLYDSLDRLTRGTTQLSDTFCQAQDIGNGVYDESYVYNYTTGNLSSKGGNTLLYEDTSHKHAVTKLGSNDTYTYDANGNQITHTYSEGSYTFSYDAENHLVSINGSLTATFIYDGDGNRVKGTVAGTTTAYLGEYFEWTGSTSTMRSYYFEGSVRVAMRSGSTLRFLLGDHLGSTSITTDSSGIVGSTILYTPWGGRRFVSGSIPTNYQYTDQRIESNWGVYFYGARWYDPALGRFTSPDTVTPTEQGVQAWDRFAYVNNSPVKYADPTGHKMVCDPEDPNCNQEARHKNEPNSEEAPFDANLGGNNENIEDDHPNELNFIENILADERTPVVTSAINVLTTDIAFISSTTLPTPLAPFSGVIVVTSYLVGRGASVVNLVSTAYQYRHSLNGVTKTDVIISSATMIVSAMPIAQLQVANHISFVYTLLRYLGAPSP